MNFSDYSSPSTPTGFPGFLSLLEHRLHSRPSPFPPSCTPAPARFRCSWPALLRRVRRSCDSWPRLPCLVRHWASLVLLLSCLLSLLAPWSLRRPGSSVQLWISSYPPSPWRGDERGRGRCWAARAGCACSTAAESGPGAPPKGQPRIWRPSRAIFRCLDLPESETPDSI